MRKQREILEDQADAAPFRRQVHAIVRQDLPIGEHAPDVWRSIPAMVRRTVDLPQPDGPRRHRMSPASTRKRHVAHHLAAIELAADAVDLQAGRGGHGTRMTDHFNRISQLSGPHRTGKKSDLVTAGRRSITVSARMRPLTCKRDAVRAGNETVGGGIGLEPVGFLQGAGPPAGIVAVFSLWTLALSRAAGPRNQMM
jgi:hypothetical protein